MLLHTGTCNLTIDVDRAVSRTSIDEALSCGVQGGEVCPDQGGQHFVASVSHQAVVLWVLDQVIPGWVLLPSIVPADNPHQLPFLISFPYLVSVLSSFSANPHWIRAHPDTLLQAADV